VRDRDGLTRPMLRRAALRMAVCRQQALRRLGSAYLRADPPAPEELPVRTVVASPSEMQPLVSPPVDEEYVIDLDPATVVEEIPPGAAVV